MLKHLVISLFLLVCSVSGQDTAFSIRGFGGLDTRSSDFSVPPNMARQAHNIDWGENIGAITKRLGYTAVDTLTAVDSILDIYAAYYSDGGQRLILVVDSQGVGYGNVYATNRGSTNLSYDSLTRIATLFPIVGAASFTMFNDNVFIMNGVSAGRVWDGKQSSALEYPVATPGGVTAIPIIASDSLDGEYRYAVKHAEGDSSVLGYISGPYAVSGGYMLLSNFPHRVNDTLYSGGDSVTYEIWRSTGDMGRLDKNDTMWYTGLTVHVDSTNYSTATVTDSVSDDSLRSSGESVLVPVGTGTNAFTEYVAHNAGILNDDTIISPGGLTIIAEDQQSVDPDTLDWSISLGYYDTDQPHGWRWVMVWADTLNGLYSDTGVGVSIFNTSAEFWFSYTLNVPSTDKPVVAQIYRAPLYINRDKLEFNNEIPAWYIPPSESYYLVGTVAPGGQLIDSLPWDSVVANNVRLQQQEVPPFIEHPHTVGSRLVGSHKSTVYLSDLDTARFQGLSSVSVGKYDGDEITITYETRNAIRVAQNNAMYNIYKDANGDWNETEVTQGFGIIAPGSYARGVGGHYYLTGFGVMRENEGQYLERTQAIELVSDPLDNLTNLPITTLREAQGFYHDQKYMLCIGDTTYVYDEQANAWSTWGLTFSSAVHYGTESGVEFIPGDSMYFTIPGDSALYRYGATTDNGAQIIVQWKSVPLFVDPMDMQITSLGLWHKNASASDTVWAIYYADGQLLTTDTSSFVSLASRRRYAEVARAGRELGLFYQLQLQQKASSTSQLIIDGFDLYATRVGRRTTY